jgi:HEAT repeat protein
MSGVSNGEEKTGDQIQELIGDLDNQDVAKRQNAFANLKALGEAAFPSLVQALTNPSVKVRFAADQLLIENRGDWRDLATPRTVRALVADLTCSDGFNRLMARRALAYLGKPAVSELTRSLESQEALRRWEAAKVLSQIGDAAATVALIKALTDKVFDVRWLAAEGLIAVGRSVAPALLREVMKNPESIALREGAHHVLHDINNENIAAAINPVLKALEDSEATLEVPLVARRAIETLEKTS